jgi:hypothetical protein
MHVEKLPAILRYKIIFTYDVPVITNDTLNNTQTLQYTKDKM